MSTVFSHIIQKRFSKVNEDVATDALAFVLESSDAARRGMMKLLRGIVAAMPELRFRTQEADGTIRPDMWGYAEGEARVFIENKFWAGLTDNQPVSYLHRLSTCRQPALLLVVAPAAREHTLWRELTQRLAEAGVDTSEASPSAGIAHIVSTSLGPSLALTSWSSILSAMEQEAGEDAGAIGDIRQLRALCDAADSEAFVPLTKEAMSDQRTPALMLQFNTIVQATVDRAVAEQVASVTSLRPQASAERIGRYVWLPKENLAGAWFGLHFGLWKVHGTTPLWLVFVETDFGRAGEVRRVVEPWAEKHGVLTVTYNREFCVGLNIPAGEEQPAVVRALVESFREIGTLVERFSQSKKAAPDQDE